MGSAAGEERGAAWLDALEAACAVERKPQLFLWMQTHLRRFLPHDLAVCGVAAPIDHRIALSVFHGVPLAPEAMAALADAETALMRLVAGRCVQQPHRALTLPLEAAGAAGAALRRQGFEALLVQGVPGGRETQAMDSIFVFGRQGRPLEADSSRTLSMLLPQLHLMSLRVAAGEEGRAEARARPRSAPGGDSGLTLRERQILAQAREGKRNAEIGAALGISGLTVKTHLQNLLRKLGASNRAQAVAEAMARNLLAGMPSPPAPLPAPGLRVVPAIDDS